MHLRLRAGNYFPNDRSRYAGLVEGLSSHDKWRNRDAWWASSLANTARSGWFSSDRTIREY